MSQTPRQNFGGWPDTEMIKHRPELSEPNAEETRQSPHDASDDGRTIGRLAAPRDVTGHELSNLHQESESFQPQWEPAPTSDFVPIRPPVSVPVSKPGSETGTHTRSETGSETDVRQSALAGPFQSFSNRMAPTSRGRSRLPESSL
jgi:hypothetical protein